MASLKKLLMFTALSTMAASSAWAAELDEAKVNEMIKSYIYEHPEVVVEALQRWQVKQEAVNIKEQQDAIAELGTTAFKNGHYPITGNPNGDVTIIEFFDYNCPACKMMFGNLDALLEEDKKVKVVFVEYPIFGPTSDDNAKLALAVNKMDPTKYYPFHKAMMSHEGEADLDYALSIAKGLGLDPEKLRAEMQKDEYQQMIEKDRELAQKLKIRGTPAMIIGKDMVNSALSLEDLKTHVRWARTPEKKK